MSRKKVSILSIYYNTAVQYLNAFFDIFRGAVNRLGRDKRNLEKKLTLLQTQSSGSYILSQNFFLQQLSEDYV